MEKKSNAASGDAGHDHAIAQRLARDPKSKDAKLDAGLDESMDASDPPAITAPGTGKDPAPSSGYDPEHEKSREKASPR
jgi:hypothetical protein